jgi:hypothetical protein
MSDHGTVPTELARLPPTWKRHHPAWDYRLWTDGDSRQLVADCYPALLPTYDTYDYPIQRVDAVRYCLLNRFGGVYVDMDIECLRPVDELLGEHEMVLTLEPPIHARYMGLRSVLSNAFMAARPGHPFLAEILEDLTARPRPAVLPRDVFASTGPQMVTRIHARRPRPDVRVVDHRAVSPYAADSPGLHSIRRGDNDALSYKLSCLAAGAYAVHYWANTWSPGLQVLVNPAPHEVAGFAFFEGCDSAGFDIRQEGRNIEALARTCREWEEAVGFNTDGCIKSRIRPRWKWRRMRDKPATEGLYVKRSVLASPWWSVLGAGHGLKRGGRSPRKP